MLKIGNSWKKKLAVSSFILTFLVSITAPGEMKLFPMWETMKCGTPSPEKFACYSFPVTKKIMKVDLDLQSQLQELEGLKLKYTNSNLAYEKLNKANTLLSQSIERLEKRNKEKSLVLEKTTIDLKKAEARSVWNYLPWIITGAVALAGIGFGAGLYLGSR